MAQGEWEIFTIKVDQKKDEGHSAREEATARFEGELYDLVKKYQGQAGLEFTATNSSEAIRQY